MQVIDRYQLLRKYRKPNIHKVEGNWVIYVGHHILNPWMFKCWTIWRDSVNKNIPKEKQNGIL